MSASTSRAFWRRPRRVVGCSLSLANEQTLVASDEDEDEEEGEEMDDDLSGLMEAWAMATLREVVGIRQLLAFVYRGLESLGGKRVKRLAEEKEVQVRMKPP